MRAIEVVCSAALIALFHTAASAKEQTDTPAAESASTDQKLIPPEVIHRVEPVYPERAVAEQRSGDVVLALDIDEHGKVAAVRVVEGLGFGMDEAAATAAEQLEFKPAMRGTTAIRSRILYKMSFTLRETPDNTAPAAEPATPPAATLRGVVQVGETDAPCGGARVQLHLNDGQVLTAATDPNGAFEFHDVAPGKAALRVSLDGYKTLNSDETLVAGEQVEIKYRLFADDGSIEVVVQGERADREVTRRTVQRQELAVIPGTSGDALRAVQALPGVGRTPTFSGLLVVRGSSPHGTQTFVDGTYVPVIYHFGGLSSIVPTEMIETIDFLPGNFSAQYGRVTGGIVDVKLRDIDQDGKYHGLAQVDLIDARLMLRGPVPLLKGWSFNMGARRSHVDTWIGSVMSDDAGFRTAPVYYDWQLFAETKPTPRSLFRVGMFGSDDRLEMVLKKTFKDDPGLGNSLAGEQRTMRLSAIYRNQINNRASVNMTASIGLDKEYSSVGAVSNVDINYVPMIVRGDFTYKLTDRLSVRAGPDVIVYHYDADITSIRPPEPGEVDGDNSNRPLLRYASKGYFTAPAGFAELEWTPVERAKLLFGARADYFNLTSRWDFSPRFNARYDLHQGPNRTTIKTGLGVFNEPPQIVQAIVPFGNPDLDSNHSVHASLGIEQNITRQVQVSVEGFYKHLDRLVTQVQNPDGSTGYGNAGRGYVYGSETLVRWNPGGRFFGWVAYTLSRSVRQDAADQPERVYEYDQTHNLTVLGSYELGRGWRVGGRFRYVTGNPYTPCAGGALNAASGTYECIQGQMNSRRIPAFHQLDLRVDKTWDLNAFKLTAYLDVQNVYNRGNAEGINYDYRKTNAQWREGLPILPSLGLRGEF